MRLTIKREKDNNRGVVVSTDTDNAIVFICTGVISSEHDTIKEELKIGLNTDCKADLYFTRNLTSIFIFDAEALNSIDSTRIKELIPDIIHQTVYNGSVLGSRMKDLNVIKSKNELKISKKFQTLLTMHRG